MWNKSQICCDAKFDWFHWNWFVWPVFGCFVVVWLKEYSAELTLIEFCFFFICFQMLYWVDDLTLNDDVWIAMMMRQRMQPAVSLGDGCNWILMSLDTFFFFFFFFFCLCFYISEGATNFVECVFWMNEIIDRIGRYLKAQSFNVEGRYEVQTLNGEPSGGPVIAINCEPTNNKRLVWHKWKWVGDKANERCRSNDARCPTDDGVQINRTKSFRSIERKWECVGGGRSWVFRTDERHNVRNDHLDQNDSFRWLATSGAWSTWKKSKVEAISFVLAISSSKSPGMISFLGKKKERERLINFRVFWI